MPKYFCDFEYKLPPSGWFLAFMLTFYVLAGLIGKDPWKGEDAIHINVAWQILETGNWKNLTLAGETFVAPPLYYWSAAIFGKIFSQYLGFLALHDAIRLASGFWLSLSLVALYYGAREQFGQQSAAATPMLLAGCIGLIIHAHDAQPMLVALAAYSTSLVALFIAPLKPHLTAIFLTLALLSSLLGVGILLTLPLFLLSVISIFLVLVYFWHKNKTNENNKNAIWQILAILIAVVTAIFLTAIFVWLNFLTFDSIRIHFNPNHLGLDLLHLKLLKLIDLFAWFLFPVLPLAIWSLFYQRQKIFDFRLSMLEKNCNFKNDENRNSENLDISTILSVILWISTSFLIIFSAFFGEISKKSNELLALLLIPELAMLATLGVLNLRRGAAAAFDWFSVTCFSVFCGFVWVCWSAMRFGFPSKLSERIYILRPGFVAENFFDKSVLILLILAICATLYWIFLLFKLPKKSPYKCLTHWTLGLTIFWFLAASLVMSWFDYGKSYRPIGKAIVKLLPPKNDSIKNNPNDKHCLAEIGLTTTQRASFSYFTNIVKIEKINPLVNTKTRCDYVVLSGERYKSVAKKLGYQVDNILWQGKRKKEKFYLIKK